MEHMRTDLRRKEVQQIGSNLNIGIKVQPGHFA